MALPGGDIADFTTVYNYLTVRDELPEHADAIVIGGAGPRTDMADCAAELYRLGMAPVIVVSGYRHPYFQISEADLLASSLLEQGVPETAIIRERRASNTGENIRFAARRLLKLAPKTVILIHRPFMTRRFKAAAEAQWPAPQPKFFATSTEYSFTEYYELDQLLGLGDRMLWSMLGDYQRLTTYAKRGWQAPVPSDPAAEAAYHRLTARGYTKR